jgi:phosphoesterase RecJ-like protein
MSEPIPQHRRESVSRVYQALSGAGKVILTTHINGDGDGSGSEVALATWLRDRGKEAWILNPTPFPPPYRFLLPDRDWSVDPGTERARTLAKEADLAVVVDTGEATRIGRIEPLIKPLPRVIIDHHPPGETPMDGVAVQDPSAAAAGELVYDVLNQGRGDWPEAVAPGLYVAILTDTGSFRFSNTSPRVLRVAADLVRRGADPEALARKVYGQVPIRKLLLLRASLETLKVAPEGGVAWMTVPGDVFNSLSATPDDLEGLVDFPRSVEGVEAALLFRTTAGGATKVSFRSNGPVDVNKLAVALGGGGHVKAAGALVEKPLDDVRAEAVEMTLNAVREVRKREGTDEGER